MDALGNPFSSAVCHKEDGLFNHKLLESDVYYSCRTGILLNLEGIKQVFTVGQNLPQTPPLPIGEEHGATGAPLAPGRRGTGWLILLILTTCWVKRAMTELDDTLEMVQEAELP